MALSMKVVLISVVVLLVVAGAIVGIVFAVKGGTCEGTPAIKNLAAAGENGNMILTWDVEDTTKYCSLDYEVTYFIGEEKIESIFTDDPTYTFMNVEPCALIRVIVVPQSAEGSSGEPAETTYEADLGEVKSLVVNVDGEKLIFSLTVPNEYKYCKYGITIDNEVLAFNLEGREYSHDIDAIDLVSCTENTYRAFTVGQGLSVGTQVEYKYTIGVITPVGNIHTVENGADNTLTVSWDAPEGIDSCLTDQRVNSPTYTVLYINGANEEPCTTVTETSVTCPFDADDCKGYKIKITTNAGDLEGRPHTENRIASVGPATALDVIEVNNKLNVEWVEAESSANCDIKYKLKYSDGVIEREGETETETFSFDLESAICTTVKISVIPFIDDFYGEESSKDYDVVGGLIVTGIEIAENDGKLEVHWEAPADAGACKELTYVAIYTYKVDTQDQEVKSDHLSVESYEFDLNSSPCEKLTIGVTTFNGELHGKEISEEYFVSIPPVTDITISHDGTRLLASWAAPVDTAECDLTYTATYTDAEGTKIDETDPSATPDCDFVLESSPCEKLTIAVIPHHTNVDVSGTESSKDHYVMIPAVRDLKIEPVPDQQKIVSTWLEPEEILACSTLSYDVTYFEDGVETDTDIVKDPDTLKATLDVKNKCARLTVSVVPISIESKGTLETSDELNQMGDVGEIEIEQTTGEQEVVANWVVPNSIKDCPDLSYDVKYFENGVEVPTVPDPNLPPAKFNIQSECAEVKVSVLPKSPPSEGIWKDSRTIDTIADSCSGPGVLHV